MSDKVTDSFNCNMRVLVLHIFVLDYQKLCVFPSSCIKWHSHSLQLTKGPAGSCVEKTQTESSMWCQYFIVVTYRENDSLLRHMKILYLLLRN